VSSRTLATVEELIIDPASDTRFVVLREVGGDRTVPIFIGQGDANSIVCLVEGVERARPTTHDLVCQVLESLGATVESVSLTNVDDNTIYAEIALRRPSGEMDTIDCRPSDAIALCLRAGAPLFIDDRVFRDAGLTVPSELPRASEDGGPKPIAALAGDDGEDILGDLGDEAFGRWKM